MEDFVYLLNKPTKTLDENVNNTLNKTVVDVYGQSDGTIDIGTLQISLFGSYILNIPKAIVSTILTPKLLFPIVSLYKVFSGTELTIKEILKKLSKLFFKIIKNVFWLFIKTFWTLVKKDLLVMIKKIGIKILSNKIKRIKTIILTLISLIVKTLETGIESCEEIFGTILSAIKTALNAPGKIPIPGLLLILSEKLPGFSTDRAFMNITERLESMGVNTGTIYGEDNDLLSLIKGIVDGHTDEMDNNSFVKIALKPAVIPSGPGGAIITPMIEGVGKMF
jgi:hypothetical protein